MAGKHWDDSTLVKHMLTMFWFSYHIKIQDKNTVPKIYVVQFNKDQDECSNLDAILAVTT